jgi:DNA-binding MarR family transcriptional regulator
MPRSLKRGTTASSARAAASHADLTEVLEPLTALIGAFRVATRVVERRLGISAAQLFVLQKLAEGPVGSLNELAARTFNHQSSVSVVVARLLARGFVTRSIFPDDARRVTIALTAAGRAVLRKAPEPLQARLLDGIGRMPRTERKALARSLERLVREAGIAGGTAATLFDEETLRPRLVRRDRRRPR